MAFDEAGFAAFLELLPQQLGSRAIRHVVEVRHGSFAAPFFTELLRRHRVAVALVDDDNYPALEAITGDFVYARLRRCAEGEPIGYAPDALDGWAARFRQHSAESGHDCFVYFINGAKIRAPAAAQALLQRLAK
jgi:uncharacterized protein YecE (DUF72 family)